MASNDEIMLAIGKLQGTVESVQKDVSELKTYGQTSSARIGSLERSRSALWAGLLTAKGLIVAGFTYLSQRGA